MAATGVTVNPVPLFRILSDASTHTDEALARARNFCVYAMGFTIPIPAKRPVPGASPKGQPLNVASDTTTGAAPEIQAAIQAANAGRTAPRQRRAASLNWS